MMPKSLVYRPWSLTGIDRTHSKPNTRCKRWFLTSRSVLKPAFESRDDHGPTLTVADQSYHQVAVTVGHAMTLFGPVDFERSRYRPSGTGASIIPVACTLGAPLG